MSKLDPYYIPSPATGLNPFAQLPRRLSVMAGSGKIYGPKDLFYSCIELLKDSDAVDGDDASNGERMNGDNPLYRKAVSMISHEPLYNDDIEAEVDAKVKSKC